MQDFCPSGVSYSIAFQSLQSLFPQTKKQQIVKSDVSFLFYEIFILFCMGTPEYYHE